MEGDNSALSMAAPPAQRLPGKQLHDTAIRSLPTHHPLSPKAVLTGCCCCLHDGMVDLVGEVLAADSGNAHQAGGRLQEQVGVALSCGGVPPRLGAAGQKAAADLEGLANQEGLHRGLAGLRCRQQRLHHWPKHLGDGGCVAATGRSLRDVLQHLEGRHACEHVGGVLQLSDEGAQQAGAFHGGHGLRGNRSQRAGSAQYPQPYLSPAAGTCKLQQLGPASSAVCAGDELEASWAGPRDLKDGPLSRSRYSDVLIRKHCCQSGCGLAVLLLLLLLLQCSPELLHSKLTDLVLRGVKG
mmetsp:Transcript_17395/g.48509  ORF Transcript_17395/g.48509 Transcript_17395/m.48509 type:complete len:297 (-) Transcript_17395:362-1252(-)